MTNEVTAGTCPRNVVVGRVTISKKFERFCDVSSSKSSRGDADRRLEQIPRDGRGTEEVSRSASSLIDVITHTHIEEIQPVLPRVALRYHTTDRMSQRRPRQLIVARVQF